MGTGVFSRTALVLLGAWCAWSATSPAFSQEVSEDGTAPVATELVVTATRIETETEHVGSTVTVITAEELKAKQHRTVADALEEVPGVEIRRTGLRGSQVSIFTRGTDSDHTLVLVDGVQISDPSNPAGSSEISHLLVQDIERIEIVRGPQSTLYGSDAIGGVIHIITKKGKGAPRAILTQEFGSRQFFSSAVSVSGGTDRTDYAFSLQRESQQNFSVGSLNSEDDAYRNTTFSARGGHTFGEHSGVRLVFRHIADHLDTDAGADPTRSDAETRQTIAKVEPYWAIYDGMWQQKLSITRHDITRENEGVGFFANSKSQGTILGLDWQNDLALRENNTFTFGVELEQQEVNRDRPFFPEFDDNVSNRALYVQDVWQPTSALTLTLGARVDDHDEFGTEPTFRGALAYNIESTGTTFRASAGTGFKAPSLSELFDNTFGSNNRDLEPEESVGFDVGIEQRLWDDRLRFGVTYFYNDIDEMIVAVFNPATFSFRSENIEEVETQGVEAFARVEPVDGLTFGATYTYTDTEAQEAASFGIADGDQLLRRPEHKFTADASYRFMQDRAQVTVSYLYVGERRDLDPMTFLTVDADEYHVVDLSASYRPVERLELFGRVENVLDERYEDVLGFNAPRFGVFAGASLTIGGGAD